MPYSYRNPGKDSFKSFVISEEEGDILFLVGFSGNEEGLVTLGHQPSEKKSDMHCIPLII